MPKSIAVKPKRRGRPPAGGRDPFVGIRLPAETISAVDRWARNIGISSRSAAIRRLLDQALEAPVYPQRKPGRHRGHEKASELAHGTVEHIVDKSLPVAEQQRRKRALIKGPKEFRGIREDSPKPRKT
jgi:hypothetical protein